MIGTDAELEGLAKRFGPHALAVSLLGVYLYENDPRHGTGAARVLERLPGDEPLDRVLAGFEQRLAASAELEVFYLLGLFDRPADAGCLGALRAEPPIPGLTDRVVELSDAGGDRVSTGWRTPAGPSRIEEAGPPRSMPIRCCGSTSRSNSASASPRPGARDTGGSTSI